MISGDIRKMYHAVKIGSSDQHKPGVHLIVTIATIAEKSVRHHSGQMEPSLLTTPMIIMIVTITIAGIGSGSIPAIVTIVNDRNDHMDTGQRS